MISQTDKSVTRRALLVLGLAGLWGCSGQPAVAPPEPGFEAVVAKPATVGQHAARIALDQVGTPYRYGGSSPSGFDCSGLVQYSYSVAGKSVPRTTSQLWQSTRAVHAKDLQAGDVLFFRIDGKMSHVGMYLGDSRFVHAPSSGRTVSVESLHSEFYRNAFIRAGRPR